MKEYKEPITDQEEREILDEVHLLESRVKELREILSRKWKKDIEESKRNRTEWDRMTEDYMK
jgi:hypothetical protein